jgi:hypothetical protein
MLNRIYANNFENTHFPLKYPDTNFPDDLLVCVSILVPDPAIVLSMYYVHVQGSTVTVSIGKDANGALEPYAGCTWQKSEHRVASLISEKDGSVVGFVCLGSGADIDGEYIGPVELDPMCYVVGTDNTTSSIDGVTKPTPESLHMRITGALDANVSKNTCNITFNHSVDGFLLDGRDRMRFGCISTVNGLPDPDNTLTINLPKGFAAYSTVLNSDSIRDPYRNTKLDRVIITIEPMSVYDNRYGCSVTDPILEIFSSNNENLDTVLPLEKPLDRYIAAYREWYDNSMRIRAEDTIQVDNMYTYTYGDDIDYNFSDPVRMPDSINIHYGDSDVVLVKSGDDYWEE